MDKQFHLNSQTKLNAVTGFPLAHTWSPQIHELIYKTMNVNAVLLAFQQENIGEMIGIMRTLPIHLLAVTLPHKQEVMKHIDIIDDAAKKIGAVNTVVSLNGKLYGYNTDVVGIEHALEGVPLASKNVLVLGAGGAARPLCWFLQKQGANILCHNRTEQKAKELMKEFGGKSVSEKDLHEARIDVIVNATPVGMEPHADESPFPKNLFHKDQAVFDFIYNPLETQLLKDAKAVGAKTVSGVVMLIAQALAQVELWLGKAPLYEKIAPEFISMIDLPA